MLSCAAVSGFLVLPDGSRVPVRDGLVIGRTAPSDLIVADGKVSRRHARLHVDHGVVEIEDLGSSNGTLLNGKAVSRRVVRDGDRIQVGTSELAFLAGPPVVAPAKEPPAPPAGAPPPVAPPPAAPRAEILEFFDDEVIEVAPRERLPPPAPGIAAAPGRITAQAPGRVLQFQRRPARGGPLGDDLRQMSPLQRLLIFLLALLLLGGAAWLASRAVG
jgi:hypothetical protein